MHKTVRICKSRRFWTWKYPFPNTVILFCCVSASKFHVPLQSYSRCGVFWQQNSLHGSMAEAPGWSTVLALDSGFGCWIVQVHHPVLPQDMGQGSPTYCQQSLLSLQESFGQGCHPNMPHNDPVVAAVSQLYTDCRCGSVWTHQKLAFTCQVTRNLLWCLIIPSLQGSWFPVNST